MHERYLRSFDVWLRCERVFPSGSSVWTLGQPPSRRDGECGDRAAQPVPGPTPVGLVHHTQGHLVGIIAELLEAVKGHSMPPQENNKGWGSIAAPFLDGRWCAAPPPGMRNQRSASKAA